MVSKSIGKVEFKSSDKRLAEGFEWAKYQALKYVRSGDVVGDWYEAALPGRDAFCMRDVSHQSMGAHILGLQSHNKNMLLKFAQSISDERDWCGYWEIDKNDQPAPVDYRSDEDFWYNLPANFDVLDCCFRQYLWTGDEEYLNNPDFLNFYDRTVSDYVKRWDVNGDGLMEHTGNCHYRGFASYNESDVFLGRILTGGDLVAAQYAGYLAYSKIQALRGNTGLADKYKGMAQEIRKLYNTVWWNEHTGRYYVGLFKNGSFYDLPDCSIANIAALYYRIVESGKKEDLSLKGLNDGNDCGVEDKTYLPEVLYNYNCNESAYKYLLKLTDPSLRRRDYPEVSYTVIGCIATGMAGIKADAGKEIITTRPHLPDEAMWLSMDYIPVFNGEIGVYHGGDNETILKSHYGKEFTWKACFSVKAEKLLVDNTVVDLSDSREEECCICVDVKPGETHTVKIL